MSRVHLFLLASTMGCTAGPGVDADSDTEVVVDGPCEFLVTDIDETLTTSDNEFVAQIIDATHDPAMRPSAVELLQAYADLGYRIVYVTARGSDVMLPDGRNGQEASEDWLTAHDFPEGDVFLHPGLPAVGETASTYKAEVVAGLIAEGGEAAWGYGNALTDIEGFRAGGVADDRLFLVGELAGTVEGVGAITDDDAYTTHLAEHLPTVAEAGCSTL